MDEMNCDTRANASSEWKLDEERERERIASSQNAIVNNKALLMQLPIRLGLALPANKR